MKRIIVILAVAIIALAVWNRFPAQSRMPKESSDETSSRTNATVADKLSSRSRVAIALPENDLINSQSADEDETEWKKLSREQVEAYLLKTKRSAEGLLNAFLETGDTNYLAEAALSYPDNPMVQWTMLSRASPEERSQWLEKLETSSPDNGLPNYLSALDQLKTGNSEQALAKIDAAGQKSAINSFDLERMQSREEMYLLAGYSPLEAKTRSMESHSLPNLTEMKTLALKLGELQQAYKASGDYASAQELAKMGLKIAGKLSDRKSSPFLISLLVAQGMESTVLKNLDAGTHYEFLGKTAGERVEELKSQKQEIKDLTKVFGQNFSKLNDTEKMIYLDRIRLYGELNTMRWLKRNYGEP